MFRNHDNFFLEILVCYFPESCGFYYKDYFDQTNFFQKRLADIFISEMAKTSGNLELELKNIETFEAKIV